MLKHTLRSARSTDIPVLMQMSGEGFAYWAKLLRAGPIHMAIVDDNIIGWIAISPCETKSPRAEIRNMWIMKYYRRLGIARDIWSHIIDESSPMPWICGVHESQVDLQCTLRSFGFTGKQEGESIVFRRPC